MSWAIQFRRARPAPIIATLTAGGIGLGILSKLMIGTARAESNVPSKVFKGGPAFVSLPLESSEAVNHNTKRLRFKLPQQDAVSGLALTSALLTLSFPEGRWLPVPRPYTPVSASDEPGYLELLVKKYPNGKASSHLHSLQPGQKLLFAAALKGYQWKANAHPHITLIAGGAGITPIYQLAQGILRNPEDKTAITLVFGVNSDEDVLLRKEFDQFSKDFPGRFKAIYTVSNPSESSPFRKGYVTKALLEETVPSSKQDTKVFVCGPPAMEESLVGKRNSPGVLSQLGYRKDQIHKF
ncbi:oxidoreductase NAD-binding domain-containing protein [Dactylonectria estremocensis]|uniref:NADH-cytochrome b5 reductase n=1 Tax=Dactylonectria estremocensis TaxID=1079267 RepID=A0A9P9F8H2_9HYPO|nr:oxidoreductase NAD-binding domain-containing protein [Dactylonectria estremocensis]